MNRNIGLDIGKWIFCFCVICLHVPMWNNNFLMPINRCAVPFFYMVTGYFIYGRSEKAFSKSSNKLIILWFKYTIVFLLLATLCDIAFCGGLQHWTQYDTISMLSSGNCPYIDVRHIQNIDYGFSTLWYLYIGAISAFLLHLCRKFLLKKWFLSLMVVLTLSGPLLNYLGIRYLDGYRLVIQALPYMAFGYWMNSLNNRASQIPTKNSIIAFITFYILGYAEFKLIYYCSIPIQDVYFTTILLALNFFILFKNLRISNILRTSIVQNATMDIYLWHRPVYFILCVMGASFKPFSAPVVFVITAIVTIITRLFVTEINGKQ